MNIVIPSENSLLVNFHGQALLLKSKYKKHFYYPLNPRVVKIILVFMSHFYCNTEAILL